MEFVIMFWGSNDFKETSKRKSVITVIVRQKINVLDITGANIDLAPKK